MGKLIAFFLGVMIGQAVLLVAIALHSVGGDDNDQV